MKHLSPIQCLSLWVGASFMVLTSCSTTKQGVHDDLYGDPYGSSTGEYASYDTEPAYPDVSNTSSVSTPSYPASNPSDYTANVDYGYSTPAPVSTYKPSPSSSYKSSSSSKKSTVTKSSASSKKKPVAKKAPAKPKARTHTVRTGENLYRIAKRYGTSYSALQRANGITNPNRIRVGQVLRIP